MDFASLDLPEPVLQGIREAGFVTATPIQEAALPLALRGKDVAGQSQTGTGKTAAFLIAAFTKLLRTPAEGAERFHHVGNRRLTLERDRDGLGMSVDDGDAVYERHRDEKLLPVAE